MENFMYFILTFFAGSAVAVLISSFIIRDLLVALISHTVLVCELKPNSAAATYAAGVTMDIIKARSPILKHFAVGKAKQYENAIKQIAHT